MTLPTRSKGLEILLSVALLGLGLSLAVNPGAAQESPEGESQGESIKLIWPWDERGLALATGRFFDHLYRLDYETCQAIVDSLRQMRPDDPMVSVLNVRIFRDVIREVDISREDRRKEFVHLQELFIPLREKAEALLEKDPRDPRAHLALGWVGMITGQVQVMLKDFMGANSTSKKARENLEIVLERHPDSPDAKALLGGYLYSVDTLPKFLKLLKWIPFLGIPSGDRKRGLEMVVEASQSPAPSARDFLLFYGFLDAFYEGEFARGTQTMECFFYENPHNPRFGISLSLMAPFNPGGALAADHYWRALSNAWASMKEANDPAEPWWGGWDLWSIALAIRMRLMVAYQWEALGRPDLALAIYRDLSTDSMAQPHRMKGPVYLGLARTACIMGDQSTALNACDVITRSKWLKPWHKQAKELHEEIEKHPPAHPVHAWKEASLPLIEVLESCPNPARDSHGDSPESFVFRRSRLRGFERRLGSAQDPALKKLLGDAYYLAGLPERAMRFYDEALELSKDPSLWALQFQTHLNRSFILEQRGRTKEALEEMKDARDIVQEEDVIRYPVDARIDALERANES